MIVAIAKTNDDSITLLASRNKSDGKGVFPRIPESSPAAHLYEDIELTGTGTLYSYTVMHPNPKTGQPSFVLALVDYSEDVRVLGRLSAKPETVEIGMRVAAKPTEDPDGSSYCFVPAEDY